MPILMITFDAFKEVEIMLCSDWLQTQRAELNSFQNHSVKMKVKNLVKHSVKFDGQFNCLLKCE